MKTPALKTLTLISLALAPGSASLFAQSSTWNTTTSGAFWNLNTNWVGNVIADGSGNTADFSKLDLPGDITVNVAVERTIGNIIFGDIDTASAGNLVIAGSGGTLTLAGANPTITVNPMGTNKFASITASLGGTAGFTKSGSGALLLDNSTNSISGSVIVTQGTLQVNTTALTNASVVINGGLLVQATSSAGIGGTISFGGGYLQYNTNPVTDYSPQFSTSAGQSYRVSTISGRSATYSSDLSSSGGSFEKLGNGDLTLAAANTFNGPTRNNGGNLILSSPLALQNSAIDTTNSLTGSAVRGFVLSGVTAPVFGGLTGSKDLASIFNSTTGGYSAVTNLTLNPGAGTSNTYSGVIADGAAGMSLTKTGAGTQVLSSANPYTGDTAINAGTLSIGNAAALGSTGTISFGGGTLQYNGITTDLSSRFSTAAGQAYQVDTNGQIVTWAGALTSSGGSLTKSGAGFLTLSGGESNTFDGPINVNGGVLRTTNGASIKNVTGDVTVTNGATFDALANFDGNAIANNFFIAGTGDGTYGALNIGTNAVLTGTISLTADAEISHNFNNATVNGSITGTGSNLHLVTLSSVQGPLTINGPIQLGSGGVTATGAGGASSIILAGTNTYSGNTTVTAGTLSLREVNSNNESCSVIIAAGATLDLGFTGIDTVGKLFIGGVQQPAGDYTSGGVFTGGGTLRVTTGPGAGYSGWASLNGAGTDLDDDHDQDGVSNGIEYFIGGPSGNTTGFTALPGVVTTAGVRSVTWTHAADYTGVYNTDFVVETSTTLAGAWTQEAVGGNVTINGDEVKYTFPAGPVENFVRLKVTGP